jgi:hypothetical protein
MTSCSLPPKLLRPTTSGSFELTRIWDGASVPSRRLSFTRQRPSPVEESNLRAQINAVRRALAEGRTGENYIVTVPGRGYRFVATVSRSTGDTAQAFPAPHKGHNLPDRLTRPIGRADIVAMVSSRLQRGRFVTLVGPGGIGKTAVADQLIASYKDGGRFVDLASLEANPNVTHGDRPDCRVQEGPRRDR